MIHVIHEAKSIAYILRPGKEYYELLTYKQNNGYPKRRIPGGGIKRDERELDALYREIEEEVGIKKEALIYGRKIGAIEYFKPNVHKKVRRNDYLLFLEDKIEIEKTRKVNSEDKDNGAVFEYEWITKDKISEVDKELGQFLNEYNIPELFCKKDEYGLERGTIELKRNYELWNMLYEYEEIEIAGSLNENIDIEHIGSTSVNSMLAKPIIDIVIGCKESDQRDNLIEAMKRIGYKYHGDYGILGRSYFTKGTKQRILFHVHAYAKDSIEYKNHIKVRDTLRKDEKIRKLYEEYKRKAQYQSREEYTMNKEEIIKTIIAV